MPLRISRLGSAHSLDAESPHSIDTVKQDVAAPRMTPVKVRPEDRQRSVQPVSFIAPVSYPHASHNLPRVESSCPRVHLLVIDSFLSLRLSYS